MPLAAFLGTAGHEVIYRIHKERRLDICKMWLGEAFEDAFHKAIQKEPDRVPTPKVGYENITDQFQSEMPFYVELLKNYQAHPQNKEFHSTIHEQHFVLKIDNPAEGSPPYLICGTIDQAGYYSDGRFVLRDIKFRDNAFKYSRRELDLNIQLTTYATALKYGLPSCDTCKPYYQDGSIDPTVQGESSGTMTKKLVYNGPCPACTKKIGTPEWPLIVPERCEMVWMYDLEPRRKDEFDQYVMRRDLPKIKNAYQRSINPEWAGGAKAGDPKGECFLRTYRPLSRIQAFMDDILRVCDQIRQGVFYRLPSKNCNWCSQFDICQGGIAADEAIQKEQHAAQYGSSDPFGGI